MKKILFASLLALAAGMPAIAQDEEPLQPSDLRIYINPGHGSWTGNDRAMPIIGKPEYSSTNTDTTGFFESNTNLIKGFGVLEKLIEIGFPFDRTLNQEGERWEIGAAKDLSQNLVMSRVKCGPYEESNTTSSPNYMLYNRALLEIATEVEMNEFDMFISIHSNAATEGSSTNYHLFMYRGRNGQNNVAVPGSWEMIESAAKFSFANEHACWSQSHTYINGDVDFMGAGSGSTNSLGYYGYLGVLKHGVPGYLVEGYFHTYSPARHRAMNFDVDFLEGIYYARGVADYFGLEMDHTGEIYGIVRDAHEKFTHNYYKPASRSADVYLPLNGVKVYLCKNGERIAERTTDEWYNGTFVFTGLQPGEYTIEVEHPDYRAIDPVTVTVPEGNTVYPKIFLENVNYSAGVNMAVNYPDPILGSAFGAASSYNMDQTYVDHQIAELEGLTVRRVVMRNERLYILALAADNTPTVLVYDPVNRTVLATVSTEGCKGSELDLSDIQVTADGILVGCAKERCQYSDDYCVDGGITYPRGKLWFYQWSNDPLTGLPTGDPKQWFSYGSSGLWFRAFVGDTFAYSGTTTDGQLVVSARTVATSGNVRTVTFSINNNQCGGDAVSKPAIVTGSSPVYMNDDTLGEGYRFTTSPYNDAIYFATGPKSTYGIVAFNFIQPEDVATPPVGFFPDGYLDNSTAMPGFLNYGGRNYMVAPEMGEGGATAGVKLIDMDGGIIDPTVVPTTNTSIEAAAGSFALMGSTIATMDEAKNVTDAAMALYLLRDGKLSRFTTQGVEQPFTRGNYAYDFALEGNDQDGYTVKFKSTGDAPAGRLILTDVAEGTTTSIAIETITAGENVVPVPDTAIDPTASYTWAIEITSDIVTATRPMFTQATALKKAARGGVTWISDTESPNFGKVVVTAGFNQGVSVYSPALELEGTYLAGSSYFTNKLNSPFRIGTRGGLAYICDWTDATAGYWIFDPQQPDEVTSFLAGTRDNKGAYTFEGTVIGGGNTSIAFLGSGADTQMFSFVEDYPTGNTTMALQRYDIGNATTIVSAPDKSFANIAGNSLMSGTNVEISADPKGGLFVAQARAEGKNTFESPSFIYINPDGEVLYNSSSLGDDLTSCGSGIALSPDRQTLAISENTNGIGLWHVDWNEQGVPTLRKMYMIPGSAGADEINQLVFDVAGNLYSVHRGTKGFEAYTIRNEKPVALTAAPSSLLICGKESGVADITVEAAAAQTQAIYYNLQGMRIDASSLTPGIYVRVDGTTATKVVVR